MSLEIAYIRFERIAGIDVNQYLKDFAEFSERYVPKIFQFYRGELRLEDFKAFELLDELKIRVTNILTAYQLHQTIFVSLQDWDLMDIVESIKTKLITIEILSKYLRTSIVTAGYDTGLQNSEYMLKQNQTLRGVSWSVLKSDDPNNEWVDIALRNDLAEEEYTTGGGINLKVVYKNPGTINYVESVVDNITGENILGMDIFQLLTFEDEDLITLGYWNTVRQSADILLNLGKNDNPEFWQDGIPSSLLGKSVISFAYPIFFRELSNVFAKDDTFRSFQIEDIEIKQDSIQMQLGIETILGEMIKANLSL